ncbi:MAG: hypothetical protein R2729_19865 [Bryobacteraceae bacterium]
MRTAKLILTAALACGAGLAGIRGPVMGWVADRDARVLRPVNGMPGAGSMGDPVDAGMAVDAAVVNAAAGVALVSDRDNGGLGVVRGLGDSPSAVALEGVVAGAELMALSPGGQYGAVFAKGSVQLIRQLKSEPAVSAPVATELDGAAAMVVDDGGVILVAARGGIHAFAPDAGGVLVARADSPSALALLDEGFIYADRAANEVVIGETRGEFAPVRILAQGTDGVEAPIGVAVAGRRAAVAHSGGLAVFDIDAGLKLFDVPLMAAPEMLKTFGSAFALNAGGAGPLWLLDALEVERAGAGSDAPKVWFVPAAAR